MVVHHLCIPALFHSKTAPHLRSSCSAIAGINLVFFLFSALIDYHLSINTVITEIQIRILNPLRWSRLSPCIHLFNMEHNSIIRSCISIPVIIPIYLMVNDDDSDYQILLFILLSIYPAYRPSPHLLIIAIIIFRIMKGIREPSISW